MGKSAPIAGNPWNIKSCKWIISKPNAGEKALR